MGILNDAFLYTNAMFYSVLRVHNLRADILVYILPFNKESNVMIDDHVIGGFQEPF